MSDAQGLALPEVHVEGQDEGGGRQDHLGGVPSDEVDRDQTNRDPRHRVSRPTGALALPTLESSAAQGQDTRVLAVEAALPIKPVESLAPDPNKLAGPVLLVDSK